MPKQEPTGKRIRIVSDGTAHGTRVYEADTDTDITHMVQAIDWHCDVHTGVATAKVTYAMAVVDVTALCDKWQMIDLAKHPSFEADHADLPSAG